MFFLVNVCSAHIVPYAGITSLKDSEGLVSSDRYLGFDTFVLKDRQLLEANFKYTTLEYNRTDSKKFRYNIAGSYSIYRSTDALTFGGHYVSSDGTYMDKAFALFTGWKSFKKDDNEFGANLYHTMYEKYKPKVVNTVQLTPFVKLYSKGHGKKSSKSILFELPVVRVSKWMEDGGITRSSNYASLNVTGALHYKRWNFELSGFIGKKTFQIDLDGMNFSYFNFTETRGVGIDLRYQLKSKFWLKAGGSYSSMTDLSGYHDYSNSTVYAALLFN